MSTDQIYSLLVKEPFNLRMADIAKLTDYQIVNILFRPEKKQEEGSSDECWAPFRLFWWQLKLSEPGIFDDEVIARWHKLPEEERFGNAVIDPRWYDDLKAD